MTLPKAFHVTESVKYTKKMIDFINQVKHG